MGVDTAAPRLRVGFFGGSFNPPHCGHVALAKALLNAVGLDEVWFVVSPQNPFKRNASLLGERERLAMVEAALKGERRLKACGVELGLPVPSYTWNTLCHLAATRPDCELTLLIGADNWQAFGQWRNHDEILANYRVAVYPRRGVTIDAAKLPHGVTLADTPLLNISSTEVRRRVADGLPISGLVPPAVEEMIRKGKWYEGENPSRG